MVNFFPLDKNFNSKNYFLLLVWYTHTDVSNSMSCCSIAQGILMLLIVAISLNLSIDYACVYCTCIGDELGLLLCSINIELFRHWHR